MQTQVFINLPVHDLQAAMQFYAALGFDFIPRFTDENTACVQVSETGFVMLIIKPLFQSFTDKPIADATQTSEVLIGLSAESRMTVDTLLLKALAAGATEPRPPQDSDFIYSRDFQDLDGHTWEIIYLDPDAPISTHHTL